MVTPSGRRQSPLEEPFSQPTEQEENFTSLPNPIDLRSGELPAPLMKIINPVPSSDLTPVQANTQSYARRLFNYVTSSAVTGALKVVENGIFAPQAIKTAYNENMKQLKEMTGSDHLGTFLTHTSNLIAKSITENFGEDGFIKQGLEHESTFLKQLTESMVTKLAVNIGKRLQEEGKEVTPVAIAACVTKVMMEQNEAAQAEITKAKGVKDPKERAEALRKASLPIVDAFLSLAFPGGAKELPLRSKVQNYAWSYLRNTILPKAILSVQHLPHALQGISRTEMIKVNPQYEILGKFTEQAETLVKTQGPALLVDGKVAEVLAKMIMRNLGVQKDDEALVGWLSEEIQRCGQQDDPNVENLWNFLGSSTGAAFSYVMFHLSQGKNPEQEASAAIVSKVLETIRRFKGQDALKIQEIYQRLIEQGIKPESSAEYIACFNPLASMLEDISGLSILKSFLPKGSQNVLDKVRDEEGAKAIALVYQDYISPAVELFAAWGDPKKLRPPTGLEPLSNADVLSKQIGSVVTDTSKFVSDYLSENRSEIAQNAGDALSDAIPLIGIKIREAIIGETESPASTNTPVRSLQDKEFNKWLKGWIEGQIKKREVAQDPKLNNFITHAVAGVLENAVLHISKQTDGDVSNALEAIGDRLIQVGYRFIEQNGPGIQEHFLQLQAKKTNPQDDPQFVARFKPLCEDLVEQLGFNLDQAGVVEKISSKLLLELVPKLLASQYRECLVPLDSITSSRERLYQLFTQKSEDKEATEDHVVVEQIENLCGILSQKLSLAIQEEAYEKIKKMIGKIPDSLNAPGVKALQDDYLQKLVKSLLMQGLANYLEGVQAEDVKKAVDAPGSVTTPIAKMPLSKILERIASTLEKHLHDDASEIQIAASLSDSRESDVEKKKQALRAAFTPLTNSLIHLLSQASADPKKVPLDIPFGTLLDWEEIQRDLIPDFLAGCYMDTTTWTREAEESRRQVIKETGTPYLPESCKVLSQWVGDFLPAYLTSEKERLAKAIYDEVASSLATESPEGISVSQFLQENEAFIKKTLCEDLFSFFGPDGKLATTTHPLTRQYVEATLLKLCRNLAAKINQAQGIDKTSQDKESQDKGKKNQSDFMVKLGINLINAINEHFSALNKTTKANQDYAAHEVPDEQFITGFGQRLHAGIPRDITKYQEVKKALATIDKERRLFEKLTNPLKKQQCMERIKDAKAKLREAKIAQFKERQLFFEPLAENLLLFTGISKPTDLPFPAPLQKELFKKFKNDFLPSLLENIFEEILNPATRVKMMISGLENLNEALDKIAPESEEDFVKDDEDQVKLNKVCGELVLQLVQLIPQSMIQAAFKIDKLRILENQSAEIIGKAVRKYLGDDLNILKIIDKGVVAGMPALHPGKWQMGPDGVIGFFGDNPTGELKFPFPLDDDQLEILERKKIDEADFELKQMRKMMVDTTHRVMSDSIKSVFTFPFMKIKLAWIFCVDKIFGKYSKNVHEFFNILGEKTLFRLIETCLSVLSYPFRATFWFFMDMHIGRKADHVIKSLQLDIHENLLYQLTDHLIESLKEGNSQAKEKVMEPILAAAEIRSGLEKVESTGYFKRIGLNIADARARVQKKRQAKPPQPGEKKTGPEAPEPAT